MTKRRQRGRPSNGKKKRPYTVTKEVLMTRKHFSTDETIKHELSQGRIGLFKVMEDLKDIEEAIDECAKGTSRSLVVHQFIIRAMDGDLSRSVVLSYLLYLESRLAMAKGEYFVTKYPEVTKATGIQRQKLINIIKDFRLKGIISTSRIGVPAMQHYQVDHDMLKQLMMERILGYKDPLIEAGAVEIV